MELEERSHVDTLQRRCAVCGTALDADEVLGAREAGTPFLCRVHSEAELPLQQEGTESAGPDATGPAHPHGG